MMNHPNTSTALALLIAVSAGPAFAAAEWTFSDIDADGDLELSNREFEPVSRDAFAAWDRNQDQLLTEDEIYRALFVAWDVNRDRQLTGVEFDNGYSRWFGDDRRISFGDIDANGDDLLVEDEFLAGVRQTAALDEWNVGDGVGWRAFHASLYDVYDADEDLLVDEAEYELYSDTSMTAANAGADVRETAAVDPTVTTQEVIPLADWRTEQLYPGGLSVDAMMDDADVYGPLGEEIGSVENVIFSNDGRVLSVVAEVGGFWDMFDTHVNIPWDQVDLSVQGRIVIPVTEENVDDYSTFATGYLTPAEAASDVEVVDDDLETSPGLFRATDLIGDYARVRDGDVDAYSNYGYVNDLIIREGRLQAVVVSPDSGYGVTGPRAYPYQGWTSGGYWGSSPYYDMPYDRAEAVGAEALDYERFAGE